MDVVIVWKEPYENGYTYGFEFEENLEERTTNSERAKIV